MIEWGNPVPCEICLGGSAEKTASKVAQLLLDELHIDFSEDSIGIFAEYFTPGWRIKARQRRAVELYWIEILKIPYHSTTRQGLVYYLPATRR